MATPSENSHRPLVADSVLLGITALWGATFVAVKDALESADAFSWLALRFWVAALAAAVLAALRRRSSIEPIIDWPTARAGALLALFLFGGFVLQTLGLQRTTPSRSAFITGLAVLLVPFLAVLVTRRWPRVPSLVGVALAVLGLEQLTGAGLGQPTAEPTRLGDLLTLGCAFAFALQIVFTERWAKRRSAAALVAAQLFVTAVLATAALPFTARRVDWNLGFVGALVFCGVFASALAVTVQTWAQARTSSVRAALIFSLEPVFAALYSVALGREHLGQRELAGGALIVLGVVTAEVGNALIDRFRPAPSLSDGAKSSPPG